MTLSIGIPTFNQAEYLPQTLESLLSQTMRPAEIVVSNNHSTDGTAEVLERYRSRVRVISPPAHLSMAAHWNFVMSALGTPWCSLLSSDDVASPLFVETLMRGANRVPGAVLVRAAIDVVDGAGRRIGHSSLMTVPRLSRPPRTFLEQLDGPRVSFAAFAVRRSAWEHAGGFPKFTIYADWALWLSICHLGTFVREAATASSYRSQYRANLGRERAVAEADDDCRIFTQIVPAAASAVGAVEPRVVERASRARFRRRLSYYSGLFGPGELDQRRRLSAALRPWAELLGEGSLLADLERGRAFSPPRSTLRGLRRALLNPGLALARRATGR
jgi:hypothetical protein